jgi:excinuclease UvrABC ATPase subunit
MRGKLTFEVRECACETCDGRGFIRRETYGVANAVVNCPDCPRTDHYGEAR